MNYAPLFCKSNFSFLEGASHPAELVETAHRHGIESMALTDRDGVYGLVRAHVRARELGVHLILGSQVTIKDGETVVIGGLISTQEDQRENKVPILGDLPGVGPLFRATQQSSSRTELLIIITPEIVRTVDDGRDMSQEQIVDQTRMIDKHMRDGEMFRRLQKRPGDQLRGVPIDLLDRNGYKNGRGNRSGNGSRGRNGSRPKTIKPADLFAPRPNVYGPPRPVSIETVGPSISAKSKMVGPKHYSQYLKQRH